MTEKELQATTVELGHCAPADLAVAVPCDESVDDARANSMHLNLQASGIAVQLRTQVAAGTEAIELSARLNLVVEQLALSQARLEASFYRIGFLEAQLQERNNEIARLKAKREL